MSPLTRHLPHLKCPPEMATAIEFSTPHWLISCYHIIGSTSIILNALGMYLLMWQNGKMGFFRYYLISFQVFCTLLDIHLTFLMQPVPLYPLIAGYSVGVLTSVFGVSLHYQLVIVMLIGMLEAESLVVCFAKKHQMIGRILEKRAAPVWLEVLAYIGVIVTAAVVVTWPQYLRMSKEQQIVYIEKNYPEYMISFDTLPNFDIYEVSTGMTTLLIAILFGGIGLFSTFLGFILDIFRLMNDLKTRISASTYQKHQEAVESLLVQLVTSLWCLGPPCVFVVVILANVGHQQLISEVLLCCFASHSSVNIISLIVFFPPYRRFFVGGMRRVVHSKRSQPVVIAVPSSIIF